MFRQLPNILSFARVVLTPVIVWAIVGNQFRLALALVFFCGITDTLDGLTARWLKTQSRFGAYIDPIADKFLMSGVYLALGYVNAIPWWLVALIIGRDVMLLVSIAWALRNTTFRSFPPTIWGKLSTLIQIVYSLVILAAVSRDAEVLCKWATALATGWSGIHYIWLGLAMLRRREPRAV